MDFRTVNPATGLVEATWPFASAVEIEEVVRACATAQRSWASESPQARVVPLRTMAEMLREGAHHYGSIMTREMGKPLAQAIGEAEKCAWVCDYYADTAPEVLSDVPAESDGSRAYWTYRPLGIVLGVMPWNFPFWQVVRFAAPALAAGNAALVKHAPSVPQCALALEDLFRGAGFPEHLFRTVFADLDQTAELIRNPAVRAVSLTGSVRAGRAVAEQAGRAIKKCVLELGGSDPAVILHDADLTLAAESGATGRFLNTGQSCIAAKRFIVVEAVREEFEVALRSAMEAWVPGPPEDPSTTLGPMAREDLRDALHDQVERSVQAGARLICGGVVPDQPGAWYPPTLLADVGPGMPAYHEELFGPVAVIVPVPDEEAAIRSANDTAFGLGASVYTRDSARGETIAAERIEAGSCFVNGFVKSDPRLPFGGTKESGYGRELSPLALTEFTNAKTIWVR